MSYQQLNNYHVTMDWVWGYVIKCHVIHQLNHVMQILDHVMQILDHVIWYQDHVMVILHLVIP